jgi:hypothetical protein
MGGGVASKLNILIALPGHCCLLLHHHNTAIITVVTDDKNSSSSNKFWEELITYFPDTTWTM